MQARLRLLEEEHPVEALVIDEVSSAAVEQVHRARHPKAAARPQASSG